MGLNASKRVEKALVSSPEFAAACDSEYAYCLGLSQHAFPGVRPYQLLDASARLHAALSISVPAVKRWVHSPPSRAQVDSAVRRAVNKEVGEESLNRPEFKAFATELYRDAVLCGAGKAVLQGVPVGVAGIAGVGLVARAGREVVGRVMGVYALGVAAAVYLTLS